MSYEKIRNKTVPKYLFGGSFANYTDPTQQGTLLHWANKLGISSDGSALTDDLLNSVLSNPRFLAFHPEFGLSNSLSPDELKLKGMNDLAVQHGLSIEQSKQLYDTYGGDTSAINTMFEDGLTAEDMLNTGEVKDADGNSVLVDPEAVEYEEKEKKKGMSQAGQMATSIISQGVTKAINAVDEATMGDKNFSASSQAIDQAVHGVSGALMKSGNPYAMAAGAGLEVINFITKAGGKNVQGFDVNINNSGYGNLGHQESEAGRIWDNWNGTTARKLKKRNEQAKMALAAADISEDISYEQEARANSVDDILRQNQIALAGGIDTSLLGN